MLTALLGAYYTSAAVVGVAGASKLRKPMVTARALHAVGLPHRPMYTRVLGAVECAVGVAALFEPNQSAFALAGLYAAFAVITTYQLIGHSTVTSCGCFGDVETPPTPYHILFDAGAFAIALIVALSSSPDGLNRLITAHPALGASYLVALAAAVYLAVLSLSLLPIVGPRSSVNRSPALGREAVS